jgi:CubicO group peptidase (beta-lactamase class C family)
MTSDSISEIEKYLANCVENRLFPSASYLVAKGEAILAEGALGFAVLKPEKIEATTGTIYDLASLTKPLVTTLLTAYFSERNYLDPESKVSDYLVELKDFPIGECPISSLLKHTSGLAAWQPLYLLIEAKSQLIEAFANFELIDKKEVIYSDLNFVLLQTILERIANLPIDKLFYELITGNQINSQAVFCPPAEMKPQIAANEVGNKYEIQMAEKLGFDMDKAVPFHRKEVIWGEVHDTNAWFLGGVAGHAGLFGTARDVHQLSLEFLADFSKSLKEETCRQFTINRTAGLSEDRTFGFQLASTSGSSAGGSISSQSFGHTGFTGTSLWIDPESEGIFVLLTNRTHCVEPPFHNINFVRREFNSLASKLVAF